MGPGAGRGLAGPLSLSRSSEGREADMKIDGLIIGCSRCKAELVIDGTTGEIIGCPNCNKAKVKAWRRKT